MSNKYKILNSNVSANTHEFLVDEIADIRFLPTEPGSTAIVAENSDVYICNNTKQWVKFDSTNGEETVFPSGKIIITENGTDIDITQYATADVNITGSGVSFGELQAAPCITNTEPVVGGSSPFAPINLPQLIDSQSAITMFSSSLNGGIGFPFSIAAGVPITSSIPSSYGNTIDAYICGLGIGQYGSSLNTTVEEWDGEVDVSTDSNFITFSFTMPDLGGIDPETLRPSAVLVLHIHS